VHRGCLERSADPPDSNPGQGRSVHQGIRRCAMSEESNPPASAVQETVAGQRVFVRNATGLVKSASALDMAIFNICGNMVIPFATGLFYAYAIWPRTNFPV